MPHIPEEIIEQIRERADLVDLVSRVTPVTQRGPDFWACCPFHHEKTPSFKINVERQSFYCFGCKKSGNAISFVKETVNTDFLGAVRWLADRLHIDIPEDTSPAAAPKRQWKDTCLRLLEDAAAWYAARLKEPDAQTARNYIAARELDDDAVKRFRLGYSPDARDAFVLWARRHGYSDDCLLATGLAARKDGQTACYDRFRNRLMFPIADELGRVVGFSARILDSDSKMAKYINSPETEFFRKGKLLYAYHIARTAFKTAKRALVCEGQLDVIACHRAGLECAVAAQGTAFTEDHARMLKRSADRVTLAFDADSAGQKATVRTVTLLHEQGLAVDIATLPDGEDPDTIFRRGGPDALQTMMTAVTPAVPFLLRTLRETRDMTRPEELADVTRQLLETIRPIPDPVTRAAHCTMLARELRLPEHVILDEMKLVEDKRPGQLARTLLAPARKTARNTPELPAFALPAAHETLLRTLLALLLASEPLAKRLAADHKTTEQLPDSPVVHAIQVVLAFTDQDEWADAAADIAASELAEYPAVGKVLAQNDFRSFTPEPDDPKDLAEHKQTCLETAYADCIGGLAVIQIDRQIADLRTRLADASKDGRNDLMTRLADLITQKKNLRKKA